MSKPAFENKRVKFENNKQNFDCVFSVLKASVFSDVDHTNEQVIKNMDEYYITPPVDEAYTEEQPKTGDRIMEGYVSTSHKDHYDDIITNECLQKSKNDLYVNRTVFLDHNTCMPVGRVLAARVDEKGLWVRIRISMAEDTNDVWTKIEEGVYNKFSIRGFVNEAELKIDIHEEDGKESMEFTRIIHEMTLLECSVVGLAGNSGASATTSYIAKSFTESVFTNDLQVELKKASEEIEKELTDNGDTLKTVAENVSINETSEKLLETNSDIVKSVIVEKQIANDMQTTDNNKNKDFNMEDIKKMIKIEVEKVLEDVIQKASEALEAKATAAVENFEKAIEKAQPVVAPAVEEKQEFVQKELSLEEAVKNASPEVKQQLFKLLGGEVAAAPVAPAAPPAPVVDFEAIKKGLQDTFKADLAEVKAEFEKNMEGLRGIPSSKDLNDNSVVVAPKADTEKEASFSGLFAGIPGVK